MMVGFIYTTNKLKIPTTSLDVLLENAANLRRVINSTLVDINNISIRLQNQQQLVDLANKLIDLKEDLTAPKNNIENILPPARNTNTKGRRKGTKRLESLREIVQKEQEAKIAKEKKKERNEEKKQKQLERIEEKKRKIAIDELEIVEKNTKKNKLNNKKRTHPNTITATTNIRSDDYYTR